MRWQQGKGLLAENQAKLRYIEASFAEESELMTIRETLPESAVRALLSEAPDDDELGKYIELVFSAESPSQLRFNLNEMAVLLRGEIAGLESAVAYLGDRVQELQAGIVSLSISLEVIETDLTRFDRKIEILAENFSRLSNSLGDSQIAKSERAASAFLEVQPAVEPTAPILVPDERIGRLVIGGVLGLLLGVMLAFSWHWIRLRSLKTSNV
jgi:chaperonin cofactor prefoldin